MKAQWWSCVLGLMCISASRGKANAITATQMPSSTSEIRFNSSVTISCSITSIRATRSLFLKRRFDAQDVIFLNLKRGRIANNTTADRFEGRITFKEEIHGETALDITITLSWLQVDDTDLYFCLWTTFENGELETYANNGSIVIVKEYIPEKVHPQCDDGIIDVLCIALSIVSIPFVLCILIFSAFAFCRHFTKKYTPSRSAVSPPPRRPLPVCPPPGFQTYSYLNTSTSSTFSQEYLH